MSLPLVLCFAGQRTVLGCVVAESGGRLQVLTQEGADVEIKPNQVMLRWEDPAPAEDARAPARRAVLTAQLSARFRQLEERAGTFPLDRLAAGLPPGKVLTLDDIASRAGGLNGEPAVQQALDRAALCLALVRDRERFRREGLGFVALDPAERSKRQARTAKALDDGHWMDLARRWAPELARGYWSGAESADAPEFLARLWSLAAHERHSPYWNTVGKALGLHQHGGGSVAHRLKPWLDAARAWKGWPELWLERAEVRRAFPAQAVHEAFRLAALGADGVRRADRRSAEVYTIDGAGTFDYDDGYSIETAGAALYVSVHIAEPHGDLVPGHPVFDEAARRMSSVYSEAGLFPMLPPALSLGRFSLIRGRPREAVTFRFRVADAGPEWLGMERTLVEVRDNLTYERAAELMERSAPWQRLSRSCDAHAQDRGRRGGQLVERTDVQLDVSDPAHVGLTLKRRSGPVQRVVEELAIAYNCAAGSLCRDAGLPALYRVQQRLPKDRSAAADRSSVTQGMAHASFSVQGAPHEGLACERYVQATSPNRRFADLVMQRQLAAHASGRSSPFTREQLSAWGDQAEARLASYDEAERNIQEHWVRMWLTQHPDATATGIVRRAGDDGTKVWLDELALPAQATAHLEAGQRLAFRFVSVDVDRQQARVAPA